jgi:hypothetical protein
MSSAPSAIASVTDSIRETFKSLQHSAYYAIAARMRVIVTDDPAVRDLVAVAKAGAEFALHFSLT